MSSTNKTENYQLSQFVGTDIPSILNDYNGDMRKIDTAIKTVANAEGNNATDIAGLQSTLGQHTTEISGLTSSVSSVSGRVVNIESKIPANASAQNKLVTANDIAGMSVIAELQDDIEAIQNCIPSNASADNKLVTVADLSEGVAINFSANTTISAMNSKILEALSHFDISAVRTVFTCVDEVGNVRGTLGVYNGNNTIAYNLYLNSDSIIFSNGSQHTTHKIFRFFNNASAGTFDVGETDININNSEISVAGQTAIHSTDGSENVGGMFIPAIKLIVKKF